MSIFARSINNAALPAPKVEEVRVALAANTLAEKEILVSGPSPKAGKWIESPEAAKLSKLVDDEFPFDESQLAAITGMSNQRYACLTGAAGTGKTTTTKKLVDTLINEIAIDSVDMSEYFKKESVPADPDDDYVAPAKWVPAIALVGFTGRSTQMIKRNFPEDWHGNIMTIHRLLAFVPEYSDSFDKDTGMAKKTMRFVPSYNANFQLPWDIVIIDEAGMVGMELWHQLRVALKPGCRIYMIGDINQLPPVHGRSVFGFAMDKWPAWELTHIHRQVGKDNPIVDNAWRVLHGKTPVDGGNFRMFQIEGGANKAARIIHQAVMKFHQIGVYTPEHDSIITPINGEYGSRGFELGQLSMNRDFALAFNPKSETIRYFIDGGRERKQFAVGDKVMATKNDHASGITNGMTGIITDIQPNAEYSGDTLRFGPIETVNAYFAGIEEQFDDDDEFTLDDLDSEYEMLQEKLAKEKEKKDRGPSSHLVTVQFGQAEHGVTHVFSTLAEVGTLMTAYVVTCHKMQGGESPTVVIILHDAHKAMLTREWLYTAITRASQRCFIFYTRDAMRTALSKQSIKGVTLAQKVRMFNMLASAGITGRATVDPKLPLAETIDDSIQDKTTHIQMDTRIGESVTQPKKTFADMFSKAVRPESTGTTAPGTVRNPFAKIEVRGA